MRQVTYLHADWEFAATDRVGQKYGYSNIEWLPATVPGHVHVDLQANGVIGDPFHRLNELGQAWIDETNWTYRTRFNWTAKSELPRRVLRFEGLDTVCEIILNGERVAESDNMFVPLEVDVTDRLHEGENEVEIRFQRALKVGRGRRALYFAQEGIPPETVRMDERAFVRKAQYMYGWDWGPRLVSCGVWKPVSLIEFAARIVDVHVTQRHHENGLVEVEIRTEIEGEGTPVHRLEGAGSRIGDGKFILQDPPRWEPGAPELLELMTAVFPSGADLGTFEMDEEGFEEDAEEAEELQAIQAYVVYSQAEDVRIQNIGIVETKLIREPDEYGESFEFEVNGRRLWIRGFNWIPDHSFPSLVDRARLRDRLERALDLGCNMLRVWGGGLYESDDFYELCDAMGILVWQDFPFACSYYPDDSEARSVLQEEATSNVRRLRNHPSLAIWCGNNENHTMWHDKWGGKELSPPRYYGQPLYEETLPKLLATLDPGRAYVPSSPIGGLHSETAPNSGGHGDVHNWDVWHGRGDWRHYGDCQARFSSEFGFCSAASLPVWDRVLEEGDWGPHSQAVRWHDKTGKGDDVFHGYVELHYPKSETLEDWVYYSQLNQRDALRFAIEYYRRNDICRGTLIWQLNDCWPTQSWAVLDSDGNYKAAAHELRRLYDDLLLSIVRDQETVRVYLANDDRMHVDGVVRLTAVSTLTGEVLREWQEEAEIEPDGRGVALEASIAGLPVPETLLVADFHSVEGWQLLGEPKAARFGPATPIVASTSADGLLRLALEGPVVDLLLTDGDDPSPFATNFITTTDPIVDIRITRPVSRLEARSLAGYHAVRTTRSPI